MGNVKFPSITNSHLVLSRPHEAYAYRFPQVVYPMQAKDIADRWIIKLPAHHDKDHDNNTNMGRKNSFPCTNFAWIDELQITVNCRDTEEWNAYHSLPKMAYFVRGGQSFECPCSWELKCEVDNVRIFAWEFPINAVLTTHQIARYHEEYLELVAEDISRFEIRAVCMRLPIACHENVEHLYNKQLYIVPENPAMSYCITDGMIFRIWDSKARPLIRKALLSIFK